MSTVLRHNVVGREVGAPILLDRRRRRLSSIVARHADHSRPFIVAVQRADRAPLHVEEAVVLRRQWAKKLIGPKHVVSIIYLPLGGGGGGGGKQIAGALAMAALLFVAPYAAALFPGAGAVGSLTWIGKAVAAGIVVGGSFLIGLATKAKANKNDQLYGVSGGGNLPRAGDRIPVGYGQFWTQPDLSQPDFTTYDGEDVLLYGRRTLGVGKYQFHKIMAGDIVAWTAEDGILPPFNATASSGQGSGTGTAFEFFAPGAVCTLVPESVYSSPSVSGSSLARVGGTPAYTGPFPVCPVGQTTKKIQIDWSVPSGHYRNSSSGMKNWDWSATWEYAPCDNDNNATGPWVPLIAGVEEGQTTKPKRFTEIKDVPEGRYIVRAQNTNAADESHVDEVTWDGLRAHFEDTIVRPGITEFAFRIRSGKALGNAAFNSLWVEATRILPVWNGTAWVEQPTRKAVYAFKDIMQSTYGGNLPDGSVDLARVKHYASTLTEFDTFDGVIRGPVSVRDAAATVLGVMRAEPVRLGRVWSIQRDEARSVRKHVITRRQIMRGSSKMSIQVARDQGEADVIVEYSPGADPRRRSEVRRTFGSTSLTPTRRQMTGVSDYEHAYHLATWMGAAAFYRRERRSGTVDRRGRIFHRGDPVLMDVFFTGDAVAGGVMARSGGTLTLDTAIPIVGEKYAVLKDRKGRAFGPILVTQGVDDTTIVLDVDDLAAAADDADLTLDDVIAPDGAEPTTVTVAGIAVQQDAYQVESVDYQGMNRVEITALQDNPAVWTALGEAAPPAPPIPSLVGEDQLPNLLWVKAQAIQKTNSLDMDWSVGRAVTAAANIVRISYDEGATWQTVSDNANASGSYPIEMASVPIQVQAYAVDVHGRSGPMATAEFVTFQPVVPVAALPVIPVELIAPELLDRVNVEIPSIADLGIQRADDAFKLVQDTIASVALVQEQTRRQTEVVREEGAARVSQAFNTAASDTAAEASIRFAADATLQSAIDTTNASAALEILARATGDSALAQAATDLSAQTEAGRAAIGQLAIVVQNATASLGLVVETLRAQQTSDLSDSRARMATESMVRATEVLAEASTRFAADATLQTNIDGVRTDSAAALAAEQSVRATVDSATAMTALDLAAQIGGGQVTLNQLAVVVQNLTASVGLVVETMRAQFQSGISDSRAMISNESLVRATDILAEAAQRLTLRAEMTTGLGALATATSAITTRLNTVASGGIEGAVAQLNAISLTVGDHTGYISTLQSVVSGHDGLLTSTLTIKVASGTDVLSLQGIAGPSGKKWRFDGDFEIWTGSGAVKPFGVSGGTVSIQNLVVDGTLVVNGTLTTPKLATDAATKLTVIGNTAFTANGLTTTINSQTITTGGEDIIIDYIVTSALEAAKGSAGASQTLAITVDGTVVMTETYRPGLWIPPSSSTEKLVFSSPIYMSVPVTGLAAGSHTVALSMSTNMADPATLQSKFSSKIFYRKR